MGRGKQKVKNFCIEERVLFRFKFVICSTGLHMRHRCYTGIHVSSN
jgi:hypothetical protein